MNPRQSSLFSLIGLIMIMMLTGCSDSDSDPENELTIKKLTNEKSSLNIQLLKAKNDIQLLKAKNDIQILKAKNDIKNIRKSYMYLQNTLKTSNTKESILSKSNELTIKKLTTEKSSLNIQILKASNDINHIKSSYVDLQNILKISNAKESILAKSNADFRVSIAKIKAELDAEHKKNKQLNSQIKYKSVSLFTKENKNKLESEIRNKYIGYLIAIIILSISIPSFIVWLMSKKNKEKIEMDLNKEKTTKDEEINKLRGKLSKLKLSHSNKVKELKNSIREGVSNPIVEKIKEMQDSRSIKISSLN